MAARFTAAGQHYQSLVALGSTFSVTMWINQIADINKICIFGASSLSGDELGIISNASGLTLNLTGSSSSIGAFVTVRNAWYQLAITFNAGSAVFYHADATSALTSDSGSIGTGTGSTYYIGHNDFANDWFSGSVAAVKVWSAVLDADEIKRELAFYTPQRTLNLARFHPFVHTQTTDYSGLGRTLTGGSGATTEPGPPIGWASNAYRQLIIPWTPPVTAAASPPFRRASRGALLQF